MGVPGGRWHSQSMSKYESVKYLLISKKLASYFDPSKKLIFGGSFLGESLRGGTPKRCHNIRLLDMC